MKLLKQSVYVLILLLVVVLVWVGLSAYFQTRDVEINPNAASYTRSIKATFDIEEIEAVNTRITEGFSVSPKEFFLLTEDSN
jgi:high-affinity nickel permease